MCEEVSMRGLELIRADQRTCSEDFTFRLKRSNAIKRRSKYVYVAKKNTEHLKNVKSVKRMNLYYDVRDRSINYVYDFLKFKR